MLNLAAVSASSLVTRAANSVRELFAERVVELQIESSRVLPAVQADADRVLRVFANLLDNALKFTTASGQVVLRAEAKGRLSEADILAWCREHMAAYKCPREVEFVDALPKSGSGKVMWRWLQEREAERAKEAQAAETARAQ